MSDHDHGAIGGIAGSVFNSNIQRQLVYSAELQQRLTVRKSCHEINVIASLQYRTFSFQIGYQNKRGRFCWEGRYFRGGSYLWRGGEGRYLWEGCYFWGDPYLWGGIAFEKVVNVEGVHICEGVVTSEKVVVLRETLFVRVLLPLRAPTVK